MLNKALIAFQKLENVKAAAKAANFNLVSSSEVRSYKPAILTIPKPSSKDQRWYITYHVYSVQLDRLVRRRYYKIPDEDNIELRKVLAESLATEITKLLQEGKKEDIDESIKERLTISRAITLFLKSKEHLRERTYLSFVSEIKRFKKFLSINKLSGLHVDSFEARHARQYFQYLKDEGLSNRTINNKMKTAIGLFLYLDTEEIINTKPFQKIKLLPKSTKKNVAYLPEQQKELMNFMASYPDMRFLARWMYYTTMRTEEISSLQVKNINQFQERQVYLHKGESKNRYERHVIIPDPLYREIIARKIFDYPPDYYIFTKTKPAENGRKVIAPGSQKTLGSRLGGAYREWILNKLKYSKDYTLYSWKHTGVIAAHLAGVADVDIMQQTGHQGYASFQVYMRSLGLFAKGEYAKKVPEL